MRNQNGKISVDIHLHATLALFFMRQGMRAWECRTRNHGELQGASSDCRDWKSPGERVEREDNESTTYAGDMESAYRDLMDAALGNSDRAHAAR